MILILPKDFKWINFYFFCNGVHSTKTTLNQMNKDRFLVLFSSYCEHILVAALWYSQCHSYHEKQKQSQWYPALSSMLIHKLPPLIGKIRKKSTPQPGWSPDGVCFTSAVLILHPLYYNNRWCMASWIVRKFMQYVGFAVIVLHSEHMSLVELD